MWGFTTPALYELSRLTEVPEGLGPWERMALAEKLRGTIRVHTGYAVAAGASGGTQGMAAGSARSNVPHLRGVQRQTLARAVARGHRNL